MSKLVKTAIWLGVYANCAFFCGRGLAASDAPTILEPALEATQVDMHPSRRYFDKNRSFNMVLGADITPKGRIWAAWVGGGDNEDGYIIAGDSCDGGYSWSSPTLVIDPHHYDDESRGMPKRRAIVGNFWTDPSGNMWLFYDQSLGFFDGRAGVWAIVCHDPEKKKSVWSSPTRLFDGAVLNKPIVLADGSWLMFASLWRREKIMPSVFSEGHHDLDASRGVNVYRSSDFGKSWARIGMIQVPPEDWEFDEPSVVQKKDRSLWALLRTKHGLAEAYSRDGGRNWSVPEHSKIKNTPARVFLRRLSSGNLLFVKYGKTIGAWVGRTDLTAFLSRDDGVTWEGGLVLDDRKLVAYPDGFQDKAGHIYVIYDRDRAGAAEILMSVFTEQEILNKSFDPMNDRRRLIVSKATKLKPAPTAAPVLPNKRS